jgi:hypothetical protein
MQDLEEDKAKIKTITLTPKGEVWECIVIDTEGRRHRSEGFTAKDAIFYSLSLIRLAETWSGAISINRPSETPEKPKRRKKA